jgi:cytochrome c oxidase subunit 2
MPLRRRTAAAALLLALAGCGDDGPSFGLPEPASSEGEQVRDLWQGFFLAALVVAAVVWGLLVYVLVRYRRRNDDVPRQNPYNIPVEVLYTAAPLLVVAALFAFSTAVQQDLDGDVDDADVVVEVVGFQWQWRFTYPEEDVTLVGTPESGPPELVLPVGQTARLDLVAEDVVHSFWVPRFLDKRDLIPGADNSLDVTPTEVGTYVGRCAEFCGLDHWRMGFSVRVVEPEEYEAWLEERRGA